jgi:hypothetical protein
MTAITATRMFLNDGTGTGANTAFVWPIASIKRKYFSSMCRSSSGLLSDATLCDLGITREQSEFGENAVMRQ